VGLAVAVTHRRYAVSLSVAHSYGTAGNKVRAEHLLPEHGVHESPAAESELADPAVPPLGLRFELAVWRVVGVVVVGRLLTVMLTLGLKALPPELKASDKRTYEPFAMVVVFQLHNHP